MIRINSKLVIPEEEIEFSAIRAQGAGGQNVNKVSSAVHLRFDIPASSLPEELKQRLLNKKDRRISKDGVLIIKAQRFRTQEKNRDDALDRLKAFITDAVTVPRKRKATRPTLASKQKRLDDKTRRSKIKAMRGRVED